MIENYPNCEKCLLRDNTPVVGYLERPHRFNGIAIVGDAPGKYDVMAGKPFQGRAGKLVQQTLRACGLDMRDCYLVYSACCGLGSRTKPTPGTVRRCQERLYTDLKSQGVTKILSMGALALASFSKNYAITKRRGLGQWVYLDDDSAPIFMVPTYSGYDVLRDEDKFRDLTSDVMKLLGQDAPIGEPDFEYIVPETTQEVLAELELLKSASFVSCDLETTGLDFFKDKVTLHGFGALYIDGTGYNVIIREDWFRKDSEVQKAIYDFLTTWENPIVFHNLNFDLQMYTSHAMDNGFPTPIRIKNPWDTMLMVYAQDERGAGDVGGSYSSGANYHVHGLKDQGRLRFDIDPEDYIFDFDEFYALPEEEKDWDRFYHYLGLDLTVTALLYEKLLMELYEESPKLVDLVKDILVPGTVALTEMERTGCLIDVPYMKNLQEEIYQKMEVLRQGLQEEALQYGFEDFNPDSHAQARDFVIGSLKVNSKDTRRDNLMVAITDPDNPTDPHIQQVVKDLLSFRQYSRLHKTYLTGLLDRVHEDGRLRPSISLHTSRTGRLAYSDPNLQNIPYFYGTEIRQGFIVPERWVMAEFDYSQLELRIIAWESQDQDMIQAFKDGQDLHKLVACKMFDLPPEEVSSHLRYRAKICVFGMMYGRGAKSIAEGPEMTYIRELGEEPWTVAEAQTFMDQFLGEFHGLGSWIAYKHEKVVQDRYVESPLGRRRRFPLITGGGWRVKRQSVNTPTQSFASDVNFINLTDLQLNHIWQHPDEIKIILTVHDSIFFEIREDVLDKWIRFIQPYMEKNTPLELNVPLKVGCSVGYRWGEMEDYELSEVLSTAD